MATYKEAGVDVAAGDAASKAAYQRAAETFASRKGRVGEPVFEEGGYAGLLDMGAFYLVQTTDGTGTKIDLAAEMRSYGTLGYDLLAMVADDAVCTGAEVVSVSNCLDVPQVDPEMIDQLLAGLARACREQQIVIPAGEIAEVPGAVNRGVWSATAVGIVAKDRVLQPQRIAEGDALVALRSAVARSNGFSLIRKVLRDRFGERWFDQPWRAGQTWGQVMLTPSIVYHDAVLNLMGRFGAERRVDVKGLAHITGGGIPSKLRRILRQTGFGAELHQLWPPHEAIAELIQIGGVATEEAYRTWNMGNGMLVVLPPDQVETALPLLEERGIQARLAGHVRRSPEIVLHAYDGNRLQF